jgi:hypothetical protein
MMTKLGEVHSVLDLFPQPPVIRVPFLAKHVDLDAIIYVNHARFIDKMGSGGLYVGFEMQFRLVDAPFQWWRELKYETEQRFIHHKDSGGHHEVLRTNGEWVHHLEVGEHELACVLTLQNEMLTQIIEPWRRRKGSR